MNLSAGFSELCRVLCYLATAFQARRLLEENVKANKVVRLVLAIKVKVVLLLQFGIHNQLAGLCNGEIALQPSVFQSLTGGRLMHSRQFGSARALL